MSVLETYFEELRAIRSSGAGVKETSYYPALEGLLTETGKKLKPRVRCIIHLANTGAGIPDGGLFTEEQVRTSGAENLGGATPARGVIEAKGTSADAWKVAASKQVEDYWRRYGQVLVTNYREFLLVGSDADGNLAVLETFSLADTEADFWQRTAQPRKFAEQHAESFEEFLKRVMQYQAPLAAPKDLAWFLASYAREARARLDKSELDALGGIRVALEEALGLRFDGKGGHHFFQSTLIQTLFYGVFSAWVIWDKSAAGMKRSARFDWRLAAQYLKVPILRKLFHEVAEPGLLEDLRLPEVLNWAGTTLSRVDRATFFRTFEQDKAVQYFYEPFLEAFDPELRKDLGVWYTPTEIVQYMVGRVDQVLREDLGRPDGLADPDVYVLDPCCGTGAFLVEVLNKIAATLQAKGGDALLAHDLKRAAMERVFGFEILPAPFVVAHLQIGLLLQGLGAPLSGTRKERVGVFLTNALTGWEPVKEPKHLPFVELEEERDAADEVKREKPILVILGNPPYNSFAGIAAMDEERDLTVAYRTTNRAPAPQGQGLNDLYVRFFRMAERRIVQKTGQGVVCFISNYSWLDGLSFTGMRERYMEVFDRIFVDNLHGDRKISEYAPDGRTSETVFAMQGQSQGIKIGTAVSLLVRSKQQREPQIYYRDWEHARAADRREALLASLAHNTKPFEVLQPVLELGLPFRRRLVGENYLDWPILPELFPHSFPGVKTSRDDVVVDIDRDRLVKRMEKYFDPEVSDEELSRIAPGAMEVTASFKAKKVRSDLVARQIDRSKFRRYCYKPFDLRWLYWEAELGLLDRGRPEYGPHVFPQNVWIEARQRQPMDTFDRGYVTRVLADNFGNGLSSFFPLMVKDPSPMRAHEPPAPNLTKEAAQYLAKFDADAAALFFSTVAILHGPAYRIENQGGLKQDWPRIPLPSAKDDLLASASLGRELAALLDPECPAPSAATGLILVGPISAIEGTLDPSAGDLKVTAGWGHAGKGGVTMPAKGRLTERAMTATETAALPDGAMDILGEVTCDVWLNGRAYWRNIPKPVWEYTLGGYQVIKKWLSYREEPLLGRSLSAEEARYVTEMARRITAILLMGPALDANYQTVKAHAFDWESVREKA